MSASSPITVLLSRERLALTKSFLRHEDDGGRISSTSYPRATWFSAQCGSVASIHELSEVLSHLESRRDACIIRGEPMPGIDPSHLRRTKYAKQDAPASFRDVEGGLRWAMVDVDKVPLPNGLSIDDHDAVVSYAIDQLPAWLHDVTCHVQLSSSYGVTSRDKASMHLWFWCDRPVTDRELVELTRGYPVDPALYNAVQIHYTAAPLFDGMADPLPRRSWLRPGTRDAATVPIVELPTRPERAPKRAECTRPPAECNARTKRELARRNPGIEGHGGDQALFDVIFLCIGWGVREEDAPDVLDAWNQRCSPPWEEDALRDKIARVYRDCRAEPGFMWEGRHFARGDHEELAHALLDELTTDRSHLVYDEGKIWQYRPDTGLWTAHEDSALANMIGSFAGAPVGEKRRTLHVQDSTCQGAIARASAIADRPGFFVGAPNAVVFDDCVIALEGGKLTRRAHAPEWRARQGYAFPYLLGANVETPRFMAFLGELFDGAPDAFERKALILEFLGACLLGIAPDMERVLILYGRGGNGKSELMRIVAALFPVRANLPPQSWGDRFRAQLLAGKPINIVDEMPENDFASGDTFKSIVSGKAEITGEQKFKPCFSFRPRAGHVISANRLPGSADVSAGFWRRFAVVRFEREFDGVDASSKRINAADGVMQELPGIVALAMECAVEALARRSYTVPPSQRQIMEEWQRSACSVQGFVATCRKLGAHEDVTTGTKGSQMYSAYRAWCAENGARLHSAATAKQRMENLGVIVRERRNGTYYGLELPPTMGHVWPRLAVVR